MAHSNKQVKIEVSDGTPNGEFSYNCSLEEVSMDLSTVIQKGVIASMKIEGEYMDGVTITPCKDLPMDACITHSYRSDFDLKS